MKRILIPLITTVIVLILSGCNLPTNQGSTYVRPGVVEKVQVIFEVASRRHLGQEQQIELVLVDEVTGIPFQKEHLPLSRSEEGFYILDYQVPVGTILTYYFHKISSDGSIWPEVNASGEEIHFRRLLITKPGLVKNLIAGFTNDLPNQDGYEVSGVITSEELGEPVPDILVSAGGLQAVTDIDGKFTLYPLLHGIHSLTAIAMNGSYLPLRHDVVVREGMVTVAEMVMTPSLWKNITFMVKVPDDTIKGTPIRLAGNLEQLGNTFQDLGSGISGNAANMPVLTPLEDGWYSIQMALPAGVDIRYKYTLGDGFWNAEHGLDQRFVTHQLILPLDSGNLVVEDQVATWRSSNTETIWFKAEVPLNTPPGETVGVQFTIAEWMPALPMIDIGAGSWVFPMISPHNFSGEIPYRYCRQTPCTGLGQAGIENLSISREIPTHYSETYVNSEPVEDWLFLSPGASAASELTVSGTLGEEFISGVALSPFSQQTSVTDLPGEAIILSPAWESNPTGHPRMLAPSISATIRVEKLHGMVRTAHESGKSISLYPQVLFPHGSDRWWQSQPTSEEDFWLQFLAEYRNFIFQYARLAATAGADELILGGEWLLPALPVDGNFEIYSQPGNIEELWSETLLGVRDFFQGKISFVIDLEMAADPPEFLSQVETIYLIWDQPMKTISTEAMGDSLDAVGDTLLAEIEKPVVVMLAIPSVQGYEQDCVPSPSGEGDCLDTSALKLGPTLENPVITDLEMQAAYYQAFLTAASEREWISGVVSQGFYPDLAIHDASTSIYGKPAEVIFLEWVGE